MNEFMETRNEKYAASLIKAFERRHMKAFYARDHYDGGADRRV